LFIIVRPNKFYNNLIGDIYVWNNSEYHELNKLLPTRNYEPLYDNIAFYLFAKEDKIEDVKNEFIEYIKENVY
jgi:hypothetical protein